MSTKLTIKIILMVTSHNLNQCIMFQLIKWMPLFTFAFTFDEFYFSTNANFDQLRHITTVHHWQCWRKKSRSNLHNRETVESAFFWSNKERSLFLAHEQVLSLDAVHSPPPCLLIMVWNVLIHAGAVRVFQQLVQRQKCLAATEQLAACSTTGQFNTYSPQQKI